MPAERFASGRLLWNTTLPLFNSVRTLLWPSPAIKAFRSAMAMRLPLPTLMPRISAMQTVTGLSKRHYRNAQFAFEHSGRGIVVRIRRVIFKHRPAIELQSAGGQPIAQ